MLPAFTVHFHHSILYYALDILMDMIFKPLFDKNEVQKRKNVIISEIGEYEDNPEENSYDIFMEKNVAGLFNGMENNRRL